MNITQTLSSKPYLASVFGMVNPPTSPARFSEAKGASSSESSSSTRAFAFFFEGSDLTFFAGVLRGFALDGRFAGALFPLAFFAIIYLYAFFCSSSSSNPCSINHVSAISLSGF